MREILFHGKRKDNYEWIEGAYCFDGRKHFILEFICEQIVNWHEVYAETVGQYSGRTDRNGVKIFEDDIVKTWLDGGAHSGFSWPLGVVEFRESAFGLAHGKYKFTPFSSYAPRVLMEVVGNIHDNPELLKEGE